MVVVGIQASKGEYNGVQYDNVKLHCLVEADVSKGHQGQLTEVVKIPKVLFDESTVSIGDEITPLYDRYGRVIDIR